MSTGRPPAREPSQDHLPHARADPKNGKTAPRTILERFATRAYRRPVTGGEVARLAAVRRPGPRERRRLRAGHPARRQAVLGLAPVPLPRRARSAARRRGARPLGRRSAPAQRVRAGLAALVFPLEQHARRRAVQAGRARASCAGRRRPRQAGPADAPRPEGPGAGRELRRPVAPAPQPAGRSTPTRTSSPPSTSRCARRCSRRPSCSSRR